MRKHDLDTMDRREIGHDLPLSRHGFLGSKMVNSCGQGVILDIIPGIIEAITGCSLLSAAPRGI
jgi:hypothetical protein